MKLLGDSATQSITLINDILYLSKLENTSSIYSDKIEILAYISEACQSLAYIQESKKIKINIYSDLAYVYIKAEPNMIKRVFDNIINNAIKFSHENQEIDIKVEVISSIIYLTIKDEGIGMIENELSKIFEPFSNVSSKGTSVESSVGLGMSTVKYIYDLHNFEIIIKSTQNIGTEVLIKMYIYQ